jgi:general secretion pathway protein J
MPRPDRFSSQAGFTLLELLVAIAIFALISVMAYAGLASVLHTREALAAETARLGEIQRCVRFLDRDLRQSVERGIRDAYGDSRPPLQGTTLAIGHEPLLELTRAGYRNPLQLKRSQLQRVAYRVQDATLWRDSWRVLDRAQDSEPDSLPLCKGVEWVELRFLDAEHEWVPDWPPLQAEAQAESLPLAVEIRLQLKDWGELTRLIALPGATR